MNAISDSLDFVPKPAADIEAEVVEGEVLLYHPQQTRAIYLNPTAAVVWALCDGTRSVRDIIELVEECYPRSGQRVADDILVTISQLRENEVILSG